MGILDPKPLTKATADTIYALKTDIPPAVLDGGNATSTYAGTFNIDGGSAA